MLTENPRFLPEKYTDLSGSKPVERAVAKKIRGGEKGPTTKEDRIQAYLDRLEHLVIDPKKKQKREMLGNEPRPHALVNHLREMIMRKYVRANKGKMAKGAARVEERAAREMGIEAHYGEQELEQRGEIAVEDLEKSLDQWISYLSDANEPYPTWFRYYVFRNVLDLGDYDKDKGEFTKRSQGSTRLFPDIDRGALAYVQQMIEAAKDPAMLGRLQKAQRVAANQDLPPDQIITKEKALNFAKLSFARQYTEGIRQAGEITPDMRQETRGQWVKYQKGTDPTALWASLQNKGIAWCTKGFATAETQLKGGDFYVYYTSDKQSKPSIPRIAIRMQEDRIGEVRGVADNDQNLESNMAEIAEGKMKGLPGAEKYKKISEDMKLLTAIEKKMKSGQNLGRDELIFLYEISGQIEGFGYQKDPRIAELRKQRNPKEDAPIVLSCQPNEIAWSQDEINGRTRAYIGKLDVKIFDLIQEHGVEHVYTSFPEGRLELEKNFEAEPITLSEFNRKATELNRNIIEESLKIKTSDYARDMAEKIGTKEHSALKEKEVFTLVRLQVRALFGDEQTHSIQEIYKKADELGLELCPPEVGLIKRLKDTKQQMGNWHYIAMKQIADRDGHPSVFRLERSAGGAWLGGHWATPDFRWDPGREFVFRLRKKNLKY